MNFFDVLFAEKLGGGGTLVEKTITKNGTYNAADDNANGYSVVNVSTPPAGNLYDPAKATAGYELDEDTGMPKPNAVGYVSDYIDVSDFSKIYIYRGGNWRYCFFYSEDKTMLSRWYDNYSGFINVPTNAKYFRMNDTIDYINSDMVLGAALKGGN